MNRKMWAISLAVFFFAYAILNLTNITIVSAQIVMGILALITAILLCFDK